MKNINTNFNKKPIMKNIVYTLLMGLFIVTVSCSIEKYQLPESGSIPDATPPKAGFSATQGEGLEEEWKDYLFSNLSSSATMYEWSFGDGNTSTEIEPINTYAGEGTFTVSLTATDALGVSDTFTEDIVIVEPEVPDAITPVIGEPSFEDGSDACGTAADGRDCWRNSDLGGVIQITGSPVQDGDQASKYPSDGSRIAYQELTVTPNAEYTLSFYYTMKTSPVGTITVSILGGSVSDPAAIDDATIASFVGTDQSSSNDYTFASLSFNTGANDTIAIYINNDSVEARVDNISIAVN